MPSQSFSPLGACAAIVVCVAGVVACSGTTTGNGTNTSGGTGTGLFGGGTGGGTSGTTTGGGTTVPTSCTANASDDSCTACLKRSCCTSTLDCAHQTECNAVFTCASTCNSQTCTDNCIAAHPNAEPALRVFIACEQQSCMTECGGSSSTTSGGTSGSSGTDTCFAAPARDTSYCPNLPARQTVKDCPNGPPSSLCVLSPTGVADVYCCPP